VGARGIIDPRLDGPPVEVVNAEGACNLVLVCEHASKRIPRSLDNLGLANHTLESHVVWDPGAAGVARLLSEILDAPLLMPRFSRLVYDCNRPPEAESAFVQHSDGYDVPGNKGLSESERRARVQEVYEPFKAEVARFLSSRIAAQRDPILITIHTFTPIFKGERREVDLGVLHDLDARLANVLLAMAEKELDLRVRRNEPYGPQDGVTHSLRQHALPLGLLNVMLEIRSDIVSDGDQRQAMSERLADLLLRAVKAASPKVARQLKYEGHKRQNSDRSVGSTKKLKGLLDLLAPGIEAGGSA
jgi:predicted N-formylglutamate amidohydrolase